MQMLQDLLAQIANVLLPAVVIGLLSLIGWALLALGGFAREALDRRRGAALPLSPQPLAALDPPARRAELDRIELRLGRIVDRAAFAARLAPMLGLAGTLIPLGPALRQLGKGDLQQFGDNLVVAFSTTIAGLLVCGIGYWIASVRGHWYEHDLRQLERSAGVEHA